MVLALRHRQSLRPRRPPPSYNLQAACNCCLRQNRLPPSLRRPASRARQANILSRQRADGGPPRRSDRAASVR